MIFGNLTRLIQETAQTVFPSYVTDQITSSSAGQIKSFKSAPVPRGAQVFVTSEKGNGDVYLVEDKNGDDTTGALIPEGATRTYGVSELSELQFYFVNSGATLYAEVESE